MIRFIPTISPKDIAVLLIPYAKLTTKESVVSAKIKILPLISCDTSMTHPEISFIISYDTRVKKVMHFIPACGSVVLPRFLKA